MCAHSNYINYEDIFESHLELKGNLVGLSSSKTNDDVRFFEENPIFKDYANIEILKNSLQYTMHSWEKIVLRLPAYETIDVFFMIPEVRNVSFEDDFQDGYDGGDNDGGDDDYDDSYNKSNDKELTKGRGAAVGRVDMTQKRNASHEGSNDKNEPENGNSRHESKQQQIEDGKTQAQEEEGEDESGEETQLESQDRSGHKSDGAEEPEGCDETGDPEEIQLETQPPNDEREEDNDALMDTQDDDEEETQEMTERSSGIQLGTQPRLAVNVELSGSDDNFSFTTAKETEEEVEDHSTSERNAVAALQVKRTALKLIAKDPLASTLKIASKANPSFSRDVDIESVDSSELLKAPPEEKLTERTKPGRKRKLSYRESSDEEDRPIAAKASLKFDDSEDELFKDTPPPPALKAKQSRKRWTEVELNAVKLGYEEFQKHDQKWSKIKSKYSEELRSRSNVNIKVRLVSFLKKC